METELFTWGEWGMVSEHMIMFMDCDLVDDMGSLKEGEHFDTIIIDLENGTIKFAYQDDRFKYKLHYKVGEEISGPDGS
ncbi:MAG: hypothetical protein U9N61_10930 [Euryarchaeota archaeon]|nr:hypothetical protein [Euryarchaeota archaeon]